MLNSPSNHSSQVICFVSYFYSLCCLFLLCILLNRSVKSKKELCLKAIELDPTNAQAYNNLGFILKEEERIAIPEFKEPLGQKELYLKAIELDPTDSWAYNALGTTLKRGERIAVSGFKEFLGGKRTLS